ncbi:hypothetical protein PR202_ga01865 [Eleusine coracana subsp. coracana]|uniref:Phosphate transporter n=1 Tax=Eleusine coracana subsp. coracana TaxID=191504 RepID=A0AAV5BJF0_ELECO|nr:hypothetical protein PR202_ga01178 [Eleusine coracana subsp. coracana]GJM86047.1 hypothetical protein PR202_ga01865 [Eleusine coracana subsp. coracana]
MSQSSPFFSTARAYVGAGGRAAAAALLLRCPAAQLPPNTHGLRYSRLSKVSPAKTLTSHLSLPHATLSSFADADDGSSADDGSNAKADAETKGQNEESELSEMAKAFNISPRMAMSISVMIAFAALTVPLAMRTLVFHGTFKMSVLAYLTLLFGFYMAWNIGANDVANAMGTSVGSGALTLRQAVLTAAVLEFSGAFLMGSHVTSTMQKGILVASVFQGKDSLLFAGLLSSLAAAGTWLQFVYSAPNPGQAAAAAAPIAVFTGVSAISFAALPLSKKFSVALLQALSCGAIGAIIVSQVIRKQLGELLSSEAEKIVSTKKSSVQHAGLLSEVAGPTGAQLQIVYGVFGYMQVLSACFMSFAHGGNDVSNAIGPLAAALSILQGMSSSAEIVIPTEVLLWGGFGIVAGLTICGYRVIATIGKKITELTPTRGFAAEFAAASVVLFATKLGLPVSATHTLVGAVMGVGFARGLNRVRAETVREIVASWMVTIPVGAVLSIFYTLIFTKLLKFFM